MPELPEVETVVRTLGPLLAGRRLGRVTHLRADVVRAEGSGPATPPATMLAETLAGRLVERVERRGKRILIRLEGGATLCVHLGMTGQLTVEPATAEVRKHTHLVVDLDGPDGPDGGQLRFRDPRRFGGLWLMPAGTGGGEGMGPEPLTLRPERLARRLAGTRRAIKAALLDQRVVAGVGNIYADEALHLAGIHPLARAGELTAEQVRRLNRCLKRVLRRAIRHRGSSLRDYVDARGQAGGFQLLHRVYGREGQRCRTCRKANVLRIVIQGRSTHYCPRCQPP